MRSVEIVCAGGPVCDDVVQTVQETGCESCDVTVRDVHENDGALRPAALDG